MTLTTAIIPTTDWNLKREVILTTNKKIRLLHKKHFTHMHDGKKFSRKEYSRYIHNFTKSFYNFYDRIGFFVSREDTFEKIKQDYGEHVEDLLIEIYNYKPKFFMKHVKIKFLYQLERDDLNIQYKKGVYQVCFDNNMLSFMKQCKFYKEYELKMLRIMHWLENVFSETEENKKNKFKDIDSMFNRVCKPLFDSKI